MQNPFPTPSLPPQHLPSPPHKLITPPPRHQHPRHHIHNPNQQLQQPLSLLTDGQKYGLNVKFEEDAGHVALGDGGGLGCDGVLICGDAPGAGGVGGGDDGDVVLVFEEVGWSGADGVVEGVEEGRVEGAEGEFVDDVREVEGWCRLVSWGPPCGYGV